jgi:hypothetical protein
MGRPFVFARQTPTHSIAGNNEDGAPSRIDDRWFDLQIKVSRARGAGAMHPHPMPFEAPPEFGETAPR